jgi:biotin carboxylase
VPESCRVAVVNPHSAGLTYRQALSLLGCETIAVRMGDAPPFDPAGYADVITAADLGAARDELLRYRPRAILAGDETGVGPADMLAAALLLPRNLRNPAATTANRIDKHAMQARLGELGITHAATVRAGSLGEALEFYWSRDGKPVVVKPLRSAESDRVRICSSVADIRDAWDAAIGQVGYTGNRNTAMAVQELLEGEQAVGDFVSFGGVHHVAGVWLDQRQITPAGCPVYDRVDLLPSSHEICAEVIPYCRRVLTGLDLDYGASHIELMITARGPVLIELNARLDGGHDPTAITRREGQVWLAALLAADPEAFAALDGDRYEMSTPQVTRVYLIAAGEAVATGRAVLDKDLALEFSALPVTASVKNLHPGGRVTETVDGRDPGCLTFRGPSVTVERAVAAVRRAEREGRLYHLPES